MTVLITGGGRGIGRAIALDLAKSGTEDLLLVSKSDSCEAVAKECNDLRPGCARAFRWDVSDPHATAGIEAVEALQMSKGTLGLVCAAGVLGPTGEFETNDMLAWWKAMETNVGGVVRLVHAVLPRMLKDGAGRIVLFAGGGAAYGYPKFTSYGTAKAALVRFTESLAMQIGDRGPVVTIIAPGANDTDMLAEVRKAGGIVKTTVSIDEPVRLVRRLLNEDVRGLHGRFVHVRDEWTPATATALPEAHWKLRRVEK